MEAKNDKARESLEKQLAEKINKREYLAIVHGNFETGSLMLRLQILIIVNKWRLILKGKLQ